MCRWVVAPPERPSKLPPEKRAAVGQHARADTLGQSQRLAIEVARSHLRECGEREFSFPRKTLAPPLPRAHGFDHVCPKGHARRDYRFRRARLAT